MLERGSIVGLGELKKTILVYLFFFVLMRGVMNEPNDEIWDTGWLAELAPFQWGWVGAVHILIHCSHSIGSKWSVPFLCLFHSLLADP